MAQCSVYLQFNSDIEERNRSKRQEGRQPLFNVYPELAVSYTKST